MKRVKYKPLKNNPNVLISEDIHSERRGASYRVYLYLDTMTYAIKNLRKRHYIKGEEKITSLHVLKRAAKRKLVKLGCNFKIEMRDRSFGVCEKGYTQSKHKLKNNPISAIPQDGNLQ